MDFDNPKVYGDTSIADGLVFKRIRRVTEALVNWLLPQLLKTLSTYVSLITSVSLIVKY